MKITYEIQDEGFTIKQVDENGLVSFIPMSETNADYQRYLRWLEKPDAEKGTLGTDNAKA